MKRQRRHQVRGGKSHQQFLWIVPILASVLLGPVAAFGSGGWVDWTGGGGADHDWSLGANWDGGVAPISGNYVRFGSWAVNSSSVVDGDFTIGWLRFLGGGVHTMDVPLGNHLQIDGTAAQVRDGTVTWTNQGVVTIGTPTSPQALNVGYNQDAGGAYTGSLTLNGITVNAYVNNPLPGTNSGIAIGANYFAGSADGQLILGPGSHLNAGTPAEPFHRGLTIGYNDGQAGGSGTGLLNTSGGAANLHAYELGVGNNKNGDAGMSGSASGTLTMGDNTVLTADKAHIAWGNGTTGVVNMNGGLFAANTVDMGSGASFNFNAGRLAVNDFTTYGSAGTLEQKGGTLAPGFSRSETALAGTSIVRGNYQLDAPGTLEIELFGDAVGTAYDQLKVFGEVNLAEGGLDLKLNYEPLVGTEFVIIDNDLSDLVTGQFAGLPGSSTLDELYLDSTYRFQVSYNSFGAGNDVVLKMVEKLGGGIPVTIPAPGALVLGSIGAGLMGWLRRRRML